MKKTLAATALGVATATSAALAKSAEAPKSQKQAEQVAVQTVPIELTAEQMDQVTAGVILRGKHDATGIVYGGTVEFEADTNRTDNTDASLNFLRGGFGELRFGDEDGRVDNSVIKPSNSNDATKIRYYTPSFGG